MPHAPQLLTSVAARDSQPFAVRPSQLLKPVTQVPIWQVLDEHVAAAFANEHALPQAPQFATDVLRFVSQPFAALPSQLPSVDGEQAVVIPHVPPEQVGENPPGAVHALEHEPQRFTFVLRFVSQPLAALPSQLPKPVEHAPS